MTFNGEKVSATMEKSIVDLFMSLALASNDSVTVRFHFGKENGEEKYKDCRLFNLLAVFVKINIYINRLKDMPYAQVRTIKSERWSWMTMRW